MNDPDRKVTDKDRERPQRLERIGGSAADAGWTMSGAVIGGLLGGYLVGEQFDWNPGATLVGLALGLVVGFYNLAKVMGLGR